MAEKKAAECCGRVISHKKDGFPYAHTCEPQGQWQDKPATRTCACGEISTMGPFPGRHEETGCGGVESLRAHPEGHLTGSVADLFSSPTVSSGHPKLEKGPWFPAGYEQECDTCDGAILQGDEIRADGQGGYECRANCEQDEEPHPDEPTGDHRKWCTRCKLLGHYSADCTTAVLSGGVVSVPEPAPATVNGMVSVPVVTALAAEVGDVGTVTLPAQEYHPGAEPAQHSGQYLDDDPPLTGPLVDKAREVTGVAALVAAGARVREGLSDPFSTPTQPAEKVNVSGQPSARYEWYGKQNRGYLVKLPETGDFRRYKNGKPKGLTRATTFNKAATDQNALGDWKARNVLIGASKRPDLVAKAHGLTHEDNRDELMKLVAELETTAGAKVSADVGTLIHELTEQWDAGTITMADIPAAYQPLIVHYTAELQAAGLRPVPGLIERTTYIPEFGGVVGTLDRVYYHEPSGQYVIGDVKTGKTLQYGMDEIETQEWIYAHGVNNAGVYDWNTDTWQFAHDGCECVNHGSGEDCKGPRYVKVSEDWGVVVHMPVQGEDAGKVMLVRADLQRGRRHAEVCHDVRVQRANKPKPEAWTGEELKAPEMPAEMPAETAWTVCFSLVESRDQAATWWQKAYDAGVPPEEMEKLKEIADARLAELEKPAERSWEQSFRYVRDVAHAGRLWESARAAGVEPMELNRLVQIAQQTLREAGVTG